MFVLHRRGTRVVGKLYKWVRLTGRKGSGEMASGKSGLVAMGVRGPSLSSVGGNTLKTH